MLETRDLILDKARFEDWEAIYRNVWSHPESARYMFWRVSTDPEAAKARMERTIAFQKTHDTCFVYEKASGEAIGFAGVERLAPAVYSEAGICLGPRFVGRGYGGQILDRLMLYCRHELGAREFWCMTREKNASSNALIRSRGFELIFSEPKIDEKNGEPYLYLHYRRELSL